MALAESFQHVFYENGIPPEVVFDLETIYQSPFSVPKYFEIVRGIHTPMAMAITCAESGLRHVMAYSVSGRHLTVLNELVEIGPEYLEYFATVVFNRYPAVTTVNFNCLRGRPAGFRHPWRLWNTSHDIAIDLPARLAEYQARLGGQTRKHLTYYLNRLARDHGDFTFRVATTHETDPAVIGRIIEMNRQRMRAKGIRSGYGSKVETGIKEFCRYYGLVCTVHAGGAVVAGAICYDVGNQTYLEAIAHDPEYNRYNAGQVCLYLTVQHLIEMGRDSFHLLWGEGEYKYRFLGVKLDLSFLSLYRSRLHKVVDLPRVTAHGCSYLIRQTDYLWNTYIINRHRRRP